MFFQRTKVQKRNNEESEKMFIISICTTKINTFFLKNEKKVSIGKTIFYLCVLEIEKGMRRLLKYGLICVLFLSFGGNLKAQVNPDFSVFWEDLYYVNPASINFNYDAYFSLATKAQWVDFPGSPVTAALTIEVPVEKLRSRFAGKLLVDRIGFTSLIDFSLSYAYSLKINKKNLFNFGLSGALQTAAYDVSKIMADNVQDPTLYSEKINGIIEGNLSLGLEYVYDNKLFVGLSSQNILSYITSLRKERTSPLQTPTNYLYAKYVTDYLSPNFYMDCGLRFCQYDRLGVSDFMTSFYYDLNDDYTLQCQLYGNFALGKYDTSTDGKIGVTAGDVGFMFGINLVKDLKLLCGYNYNYAVVGYQSYGTFEIMLSYGIKHCPKCINEW